MKSDQRSAGREVVASPYPSKALFQRIPEFGEGYESNVLILGVTGV